MSGGVSLSQPEGLRTAALTVTLFVIYGVGACRTIWVGDSGELMATGYLLGVPHRTGYPLSPGHRLPALQRAAEIFGAPR